MLTAKNLLAELKDFSLKLFSFVSLALIGGN